MRSTNHIFLRFMPFWLFLLFFKFAGALHYTLLAPYGERLMPLWVVGLLIGGESFLQMTLDIPAGFLLDRLGYKKLIFYTTAFFMLSALSIALGLTIVTYLLTIFFSIFGWLFYTPGTSAYILSHASEEESGRFFSLKDISNSVGVVLASIALPFTLILTPVTFVDDFGYAIGPVAAGILYTAVGPQWAIALGAVPIFAVWLVYFAFVHANIPLEAKYKHAPKKLHRLRHKS